MKLVLAIALGGACGAVGRHYVGSAALRFLGSGFPVGTLTVNILGSIAMGVLIELMALKISPSQEMRAFLTVGLLGGFTTFSTFSLDTALLYERGEPLIAFGYVAASVMCSVGGLFVGMHVMRQALM